MVSRAEIGNIICKKRQDCNISQRKFAMMIGISRVHLCNIEKGRRYPSIEVFYKILEYLDI